MNIYEVWDEYRYELDRCYQIRISGESEEGYITRELHTAFSDRNDLWSADVNGVERTSTLPPEWEALLTRESEVNQALRILFGEPVADVVHVPFDRVIALYGQQHSGAEADRNEAQRSGAMMEAMDEIVRGFQHWFADRYRIRKKG